MEFMDIVRERHSVKKFDGRQVPRESIDQLLEMFRLAPSSLNLQPWKIRLVSEQAAKEQLLPASFNQPQTTTCSHLFVICAEVDFPGLIERLDRQMRAADVPEASRDFVIGTATRMNASMTPAQRLEFARCQVHLALGNLLNGAKSLGLDTCPMGGFDPAAYSRILGLPEHLVPTVVCPVGYAVAPARPKLRFPLEEILC
jgi:nitroreductase